MQVKLGSMQLKQGGHLSLSRSSVSAAHDGFIVSVDCRRLRGAIELTPDPVDPAATASRGRRSALSASRDARSSILNFEDET
jgi:hypothetical protein